MIRVLIIEDDPMVREINSKFLNKIKGFELCDAVGNLTEAKESVLENMPDLILLDVFLPKENGINFLKWLRGEEFEIDVILITADKTVDRVQEAFRYGAVDYLIKPFSFERFKDALGQFKDRFEKFGKIEEIDQRDLDKIISSTTVEQEEEMAKGFNKYTYKNIKNEIEKLENRYFTAEEMSEYAKVARVTVRRYLEYMEKEGEIEKIIEYGKIGRPQYKYRSVE